MISGLLNDPVTLFLLVLFCVILSFWLLWILITSAVKRGVKQANWGLENLIKKSLELKGVSKEEVNKLCGTESTSGIVTSVNVPFKLDNDGKVVG